MIDVVKVYFLTAELVFRDTIRDVFWLYEDEYTDSETLELLSQGIEGIRALLPVFGIPHMVKITSVYV